MLNEIKSLGENKKFSKVEKESFFPRNTFEKYTFKSVRRKLSRILIIDKKSYLFIN